MSSLNTHWKGCPFSTELPLFFCQRSSVCIYGVLSLGSLFCPLVCPSVLRSVTPSWSLYFQTGSQLLQACRWRSARFVLCGVFWVFGLPIQTLESVCLYPKITCWDFDQDDIESTDHESMRVYCAALTVLSLPLRERGLCLHSFVACGLFNRFCSLPQILYMFYDSYY